MSRIYSETDRQIIYDLYVKCSDLSYSQISEKLIAFNIHINKNTLKWLTRSWGWVVLRRLAKYQGIVYSYSEKASWKILPPSVLDKVSTDAIRKINQRKKITRDNRKYRNGLKAGEMIEKIEVIDITTDGKAEFKAVSEIVKTDNKNGNKTANKTIVLPQTGGLTGSVTKNVQTSFTDAEEDAYQKLLKDLFDYNKLNLSIERLMRECLIDSVENLNLNLTSIYHKAIKRLDSECVISERLWLIGRKTEDTLIEQSEQERVNTTLKYAYVNQGLRDEYAYDQGKVRKIEFKDITTKEDILETVTVEDVDNEDELILKDVGKKRQKKSARLTPRHLSVMAQLKPVVNATQINISTPTNNKDGPKKVDNLAGKSVEQLEKENVEAFALIEVIKSSASKIDTKPLDDCDKDCAKCHKKLVCENSTLKEGMYQDTEKV